MLTNFGKALRKLRIDNDELLKDMALKLEVTVSYLSAVENGKRDVPSAWLDILGEKYDLSYEEYAKLQELAYENQNIIKVPVSNSMEKNAALSFARRFRDLDDDDLKSIIDILERKRK